MKAKCPDCKKENEIIRTPDGFYFDNVEYRCECGYILLCSDYNFEFAEERLKTEIDSATKSADKIDRKRNSLINNVKQI